MAHERSDRWIEAAKLALVAMVIMPLTVVIHELGHLTIPLLFGLPAQLHPGSISGGAQLDQSPRWMAALQAGAGPFMSVLMGMCGCALYGRDPRRHWALALALGAVSRFIMDIAYLAARILFLLEGRTYSAHPNFDEYNLAEALRLQPVAVASLASAYFLGLIWWLRRRTDKRRRIPSAIALVAGMGLGISLWFALAPPVLISIAGR